MKTPNILITAIFSLLPVLQAAGAEPMEVKASDLIEKVYCLADPASGMMQCRKMACEHFSSAPFQDEGAEWMSADEGFVVSYEGMTPESEAMARYENGMVTGYGYIFYFPYAADCREMANGKQCRFCSALLDELTDMGIVFGADPMTESLFDVVGMFQGGDVRLTLNEDVTNETITPDLQAGAIPADREGQFILLMSVVPAHAANLSAMSNN